MGKLGWHFHRHGHHGPAPSYCRRPNQWLRGMACLSKRQRPNETDARNTNHTTCTRHHDHHQKKFQKWCSWNLKRKFHHFQYCHKQHSHHHDHHLYHGQHQSCSHHNAEKQPICNHQCSSLEPQSKACQTDPDLEEHQEANHSISTENEVVQAST